MSTAHGAGLMVSPLLTGLQDAGRRVRTSMPRVAMVSDASLFAGASKSRCGQPGVVAPHSSGASSRIGLEKCQ